jgi:hypothetical protein
MLGANHRISEVFSQTINLNRSRRVGRALRIPCRRLNQINLAVIIPPACRKESISATSVRISN